ncbi:hypothetical protein [Hymenobacter jejuensis]|uniref:Uncharacterized protein n=1 Tax=Hymenobacter jejuensis TaxID=2502781 RepID=A0A5B7ZVS1_9BACT|nr:hypothetical protein [Hymenobacter jejuensis]QDA59058.1 hypothetical protein FHG12_02580 [Hymenobacter jejuensis]
MKREALLAEISQRRTDVSKKARRYRRLNIALLVASLFFGLLATTLAGDSAAEGKLVAANVAEATTGKVPSTLPPGWRNVCRLIAICTFLGTAATGISSGLKIAENQSKATLCVGQLNAMQIELLDENQDEATLRRLQDDLLKVYKDYPEYFL